MNIKKKCQVIKYSSHSLLGSINDILDFSKIEKKELKLENTQFTKSIESLKNNAEIQAKDKGLIFDFRFQMMSQSSLKEMKTDWFKF
jgi:signal transduction histidine kinase